MALTASKAIGYVRQTLGGSTSKEIPALDILNQAGVHLVGMNPWNFLAGRSAVLGTRAKITLTDATWTESSKTITSTGDFSSYTFVQGDEIEITDGTGATTGFYEVASKTDSDNIVLVESIGSGADGNSDIDGTMLNDTVALPADFGEVLSIDATNSLTDSMQLTSRDELLRFRTNEVEVANFNYYGCITWAQHPTGGAPKPLLEVWPTPETADDKAFTLFYRSGWVTLTSDNDVINLPSWMEALYLDLARTFARGYEEEDIQWIGDRLAAYRQNPLFVSAMRYDSRVQKDYGPLRGGAISGSKRFTNLLRTTVNGPS